MASQFFNFLYGVAEALGDVFVWGLNGCRRLSSDNESVLASDLPEETGLARGTSAVSHKYDVNVLRINLKVLVSIGTLICGLDFLSLPILRLAIMEYTERNKVSISTVNEVVGDLPVDGTVLGMPIGK